MTGYKYASCPVTKEMKTTLINMIKASAGQEERLALDILDVMGEVRSNPDGFRAGKELLDEYSKTISEAR